MKKIMMTLAAALVAVSMSAQVFVGGEIGIASQKNFGDAETTYKFIPEVGYNLNDEWAVGVKIGYQKGIADNDGSANMLNEEFGYNLNEKFTVSPYARYTFINSNLLNVFVDGGLDFASVKDDDDNYFNIGLRPGVALKLNDNLSFVSHFGFIGYKSHGSDHNKVGLDLNGNELTFGLYYNF